MNRRCAKSRFVLFFTVAFSAVFAPAQEAGTPRFRQYHRVFAVERDKIGAACKKYPDSFRDGIIVATFAGLKIGKPEVRDFTNHRDFGDYFKSRGVDVHMCISSTVGHNDGWALANDMPKMVGSDGASAENIACPRSAPFLAYVRDLFRKYAELKPSVIWFDDDFRMPYHRPVDYACFCESCLERFAEETGLHLQRREVVDAIRLGREIKGVSVRRAWRDYSSRALTELASVAAEAVHAVDDSIAVGYMVCNPSGLGYAPPDFKTWIEKGRGRGGRVYFRHGSGAYNDFTPYGHDGILMKNISIGRLCAMTEGEGVVNLTEEVTSPYDRRTKSMKMTFLEAALNIGVAGADGITYDAVKPNLDEQLMDNAVVAEMHRRDAQLQRMYQLVRGKRQMGLYPFFSFDSWLHGDAVKRIGDMTVSGADDWRALMYLGVPITFRAENASVLLLSGKSVRGLKKNDLQAWLGRGVLADGEAEKEMVRLLGRKVAEDPNVAVFCRGGKGRWNNEVWARGLSLNIKDRLDSVCGGRMPSRIDTAVRLAQSTWESADGAERAVIVYNLDFDDSTDAVLRLDGRYRAEVLDAASGTYSGLGEGDEFKLPTVPSWTPLAVRLTRIR